MLFMMSVHICLSTCRLVCATTFGQWRADKAQFFFRTLESESLSSHRQTDRQTDRQTYTHRRKTKHPAQNVCLSHSNEWKYIFLTVEDATWSRLTRHIPNHTQKTCHTHTHSGQKKNPKRFVAQNVVHVYQLFSTSKRERQRERERERPLQQWEKKIATCFGLWHDKPNHTYIIYRGERDIQNIIDVAVAQLFICFFWWKTSKNTTLLSLPHLVVMYLYRNK